MCYGPAIQASNNRLHGFTTCAAEPCVPHFRVHTSMSWPSWDEHCTWYLKPMSMRSNSFSMLHVKEGGGTGGCNTWKISNECVSFMSCCKHEAEHC